MDTELQASWGKLVKSFGQWVVTDQVIGAPEHGLFYKRSWLKLQGANWLERAAKLEWCNIADFDQAYTFALRGE